ncbi:hypothetical protein FHR72_004326 [Mycolicibacterium iranicum]|uniref:Uncharacterized protein n=1 Tax=Mycolicibacterium iranicum TaxID=912594 RepID=A0A839QKT5_MYCIR|nr:hypothetical protein [Mycolicibacterium iranicum]MBB2992821.1 hypothetical protein [Mycolicibacterium iranicum]
MWATVFAGLAVAGTVTNFLYTQWAITRRDTIKWRREELQKLVSNLLQLSRDRQSDLGDEYEAYVSNFSSRLPGREERKTKQHVWQMELIVEQIRLLDDELAESAKAVWKAHADAEWDYASLQEEVDPMEELKVLSASGLDELHRALITDFRRIAKLPS